MFLKNLFGKKLKYLREQRGLTQQQFAELVGFQPNSIAQIEIGNKAVSFSSLERIAKRLNINYYELFDFKEYRTSSVLLSEIMHELDDFNKEQLEYVFDFIRRFSSFSKK